MNPCPFMTYVARGKIEIPNEQNVKGIKKVVIKSSLNVTLCDNPFQMSFVILFMDCTRIAANYF